MYPVTRENKRLYDLAEYYFSVGYDDIPIDEVFIYNDDEQKKLRYWIGELIKNEEITTRLRGSPWGKYTREGVIGPSVGADFREEREKFEETNNLISELNTTSGGINSKKRYSKKSNSKKRNSKKKNSKKKNSKKKNSKKKKSKKR